jgi:hypothetical protein
VVKVRRKNANKGDADRLLGAIPTRLSHVLVVTETGGDRKTGL